MAHSPKRGLLRLVAPFALAVGLISFFEPTAHAAIQLIADAPIRHSDAGASDATLPPGEVNEVLSVELEPKNKSNGDEVSSGRHKRRLTSASRGLRSIQIGDSSCRPGASSGVPLFCLFGVYLI